MVRSYYNGTDKSLTIWLEGQTEQDRSLLKRVRDAFADEINARFQNGDWNISPELEVGADVAAFYDRAMKEAEKDATV